MMAAAIGIGAMAIGFGGWSVHRTYRRRVRRRDREVQHAMDVVIWNDMIAGREPAVAPAIENIG
ncbi:hypothetical protein M9979_02125 [Sphingomonas sp. RP10(2022)]|uniref:Uncharacterized protein n=1 Tax=Sphingomonas liriopis TaxID=2949094 RepID=A0A9X2HQQ4_9SPHN|nr:hypothetical protein [Sphingomonas liriopis]MCP3733679.1 hypothetical protein [Sphingomonas liriopis]